MSQRHFPAEKDDQQSFGYKKKVSTSSAELSHISILTLEKVPLTDNSLHFRSKGFFPQSQKFFFFFLNKNLLPCDETKEPCGKEAVLDDQWHLSV